MHAGIDRAQAVDFFQPVFAESPDSPLAGLFHVLGLEEIRADHYRNWRRLRFMTNKFHFSLLRWNTALACLFLLAFPDSARS